MDTPEPYLLKLSTEILESIFLKVTLQDVLRLRRVCKSLSVVASAAADQVVMYPVSEYRVSRRRRKYERARVRALLLAGGGSTALKIRNCQIYDRKTGDPHPDQRLDISRSRVAIFVPVLSIHATELRCLRCCYIENYE